MIPWRNAETGFETASMRLIPALNRIRSEGELKEKRRRTEISVSAECESEEFNTPIKRKGDGNQCECPDSYRGERGNPTPYKKEKVTA